MTSPSRQHNLSSPSSTSDVSMTCSEKHVAKTDEVDSSYGSMGLNADSPIQYEYLTFETQLPRPYHDWTKEKQDLPACPDVKQFISPFDWSERQKTITIWLSCAATAVTAYTAGSYAPAVDQLTELWQVSDIAVLVGITSFTCGFAIAPMFLAPFSEINGRRPVFVVTGILFVIFQLTCAVVPTYPGMIVTRFFVGCMSSTFSTMVGGVVSDIYHAEQRNTAMALFSGAALSATGLGPLVSSVIAYHTTWRWIFYLQTITCGITMALIVVFFRESRGSVLLSKKAKALNKWYAALEQAGVFGLQHNEKVVRLRWKVKADEERTSILKMIGISLYRPFFLLFTEPTVFFFSLWISFSWAVLYLTFAALPLIFRESHNFNLEQQGYPFAAITVASILMTVISIWQESYARRHATGWLKEILNRPEGRLVFTCAQSALLPIGCFWIGWSSFPDVHWIVPTLGIGCATMGIFSIYLCVFNYLADTYHRYASSALAAQSFCRNMLGGAFPLFTAQMFKKMTFQGAGSFLGGFSALLTLVPIVLLIWGPTIRRKSRFASEIMHGG